MVFVPNSGTAKAVAAGTSITFTAPNKPGTATVTCTYSVGGVTVSGSTLVITVV